MLAFLSFLHDFPKIRYLIFVSLSTRYLFSVLSYKKDIFRTVNLHFLTNMRLIVIFFAQDLNKKIIPPIYIIFYRNSLLSANLYSTVASLRHGDLPFSALFKNKGTLNFLVCKYIQHITSNFCPFLENYKKKAFSLIFLPKSVPLHPFSLQKGTFVKFAICFTYCISHLQEFILYFYAICPSNLHTQSKAEYTKRI